MLQRLNRKLKGQSTAEYAILIGLVIAAAVAMQIYVKRALQGRIHRGVQFLADYTGDQAANVGLAMNRYTQYEPYYLRSNFAVTRYTDAQQDTGIGGAVNTEEYTETMRGKGGYQQYVNYDLAD